MDNIYYRETTPEDKMWIDTFIKNHWGSNKVILHGKIYYPGNLKGYLAKKGKEKIGLVTYKVSERSCEIVTLNSVKENQGIGTHLVKLVLDKAKNKSCTKVWVITTNDNIKGIYFYQKIGFYLEKVFINAVNESRKIKPQIPMVAKNGLPIRDELKFIFKIPQNG